MFQKPPWAHLAGSADGLAIEGLPSCGHSPAIHVNFAWIIVWQHLSFMFSKSERSERKHLNDIAFVGRSSVLVCFGSKRGPRVHWQRV